MPIQKSEKQAAEMKEQTGQLAGAMATLRKELEAKLQQVFQETIKQLSEVIILNTFEVGATSGPFW